MSTGGSSSIGSISADVTLETGNLDAQLANVQGRLDRVASAMKRWQAEFAAGKINAQQLDAAITPLIAHQDELRASFDRLTQAQAAMATSTTQVHTGMASIATNSARVQAGTRGMGMGFLMLSQAIEDAQYGFSAIVNNIPGIVMSFGGSGGLAGALSIVAVGANQLIKHWDDLTDALGGGHVETAADEMKKLADNTERTVIQTERLRKLEKEAAGMKRVAAGETPEQEGTAAAAQKLIDAAGGNKIKKLLMDQMMPIMSEAEKREIEAAGRPRGELNADEFGRAPTIDPAKAELERKIKQAEIEERHRKTAEERALRLMTQATQEGPEGDAARKAMAGLPGLKGLPEANAAGRFQAEEGARNAADRIEMQEQMRQQKLAQDAELAQIEEEKFQEGLGHIGTRGRAKVRERQNEAIEAAEKKFPGISELAERWTLMSRASGGALPLDAVKDQLRDALASAGLNEKQTMLATDRLVEVKGQAVDEQINRERFRPSDKSQVFNATELASKIQAGVGGDDTKQMVKHAANMDKTLQNIDRAMATAAGFNFQVKK
jgi:hypothetical protein